MTDPPKPKRIQRKRTKGWRMPPNCVSCTRPGKFGNPYRVGSEYEDIDGAMCIVQDAEHAVECFRHYAINVIGVKRIQRELRGKDLACFCSLDKPCHADVLLEIANA